MASKVEIFNLALSNIGNSKFIESENETSKELNLCDLHWDTAVLYALRDYHWPFAIKFATLQLIEEDPTTEWAFSYGYPNDCAKFRRILSGSRNDSRAGRVPYRIVNGAIYADQEDAVAEYTKAETDIGLWPPDFILALSWLLSANVAPSLAGLAGLKMRSDALLVYGSMLDTARANAANEEQPEDLPDSAIVQARG